MSSSYLTKHVQQVLGSISALGSAKSLTLFFFEWDAAKFGASTLSFHRLFLLFFLNQLLSAFTAAFFVCSSVFFARSAFLFISASQCFFFSSLSFCSFSSCCFFSFSSSIASESALVNSLARGKDLRPIPIPEGVAFAEHTKFLIWQLKIFAQD